MKKLMEVNMPDEGRSRELFRGFNAQEVVVTLNSNGEVHITLYDHDGIELKPYTHLILEMQSQEAPPSSDGMNDTERIAMLRKGLEDLGGAIMSVKEQNTPEWMEYIKDKIDAADNVLDATRPRPEALPSSSDAESCCYRCNPDISGEMRCMHPILNPHHTPDIYCTGLQTCKSKVSVAEGGQENRHDADP